jgi:hypothetical protein
VRDRNSVRACVRVCDHAFLRWLYSALIYMVFGLGDVKMLQRFQGFS